MLTDTKSEQTLQNERLKEAQSLLRSGNTGAAEAAYQDILANVPGSLPAVQGLLRLLEARGARAEAENLLRQFVASYPLGANIAAAVRQWEVWQDTPRDGARVFRIALTGNGTLNPLGGHLRIACAGLGLHPAVYVSDFDQWAQDLLAPDSPLYRFTPGLIILRLDPAQIFPLTLHKTDATEAELQREREEGIARISGVLAAARQNAGAATLLLHTFATPDYSPFGNLDLKSANGQRVRIEHLNHALLNLIQTDHPQVLLLDQERIEARHGKVRVRDDRLWYMASFPFSESFLPVLAGEIIRFIRPLTGLTRKCIVLDLDNTLWGGVIGEDGIHQIKLGGNAAPGNAFREFQEALSTLRKRGILLALCSKNNEAEVWHALENHPEMVLRRDSFAAVRVNWQDKATNIREIARELNIGLDSLVFLDDNPAERGLVRQELPDVLTVEMPRDPALYTRTLLELDVFEAVALTAEDSRRSELYKEEEARKAFESTVTATGNLHDYLTGLEMKVVLAPPTAYTLPRITQLINKTNQFNLTTRRYTEAQVQAMADSPDNWGIYAITVADRFGDSGLTGVAIAKKDAAEWEIDSFLLSCRVLGRGIEDALMVHILQAARAAGAEAVRGTFVPTAKNAPAVSFLANQRFEKQEEDADGTLHWRLRLDSPDADRTYPEWLAVSIQ